MQVVHDAADHRGIWDVAIDQHLPLVGKVIFGPPVGHRDVPPAAARLDEQEQGGGPGARKFGVEPLGAAGWQGERHARLGQQLLAGLVEAHHRTGWIPGLGVQV